MNVVLPLTTWPRFTKKNSKDPYLQIIGQNDPDLQKKPIKYYKISKLILVVRKQLIQKYNNIIILRVTLKIQFMWLNLFRWYSLSYSAVFLGVVKRVRPDRPTHQSMLKEMKWIKDFNSSTRSNSVRQFDGPKYWLWYLLSHNNIS